MVKFIKTAVATVALSAISVAANAQSVYDSSQVCRLQNVTNAVFAIRDGIIYVAQENSTVLEGDRILTDDDSATRIVCNACSRDVSELSAVNVYRDQLCGPAWQPGSLTRADISAIRTGTPGVVGTSAAIPPYVTVAGPGVSTGGFPLLPILGVAAGAAALGFALSEDASSP